MVRPNFRTQVRLLDNDSCICQNQEDRLVPCLSLKFPVVHPGLRFGMNFSQCLVDRSRGLNLASQHSVQIECGADQREMCKGLGEITQRLALGPCLF
jgi:hypothetical protein